MASKIAGMYIRGGTYSLRVIAPKDLQARFYGGNRIAFNGALGTADPQVARVKAAAIRADFEAQFLRQRREMSPHNMPVITPELRRTIVQAMVYDESGLDSTQRMDKRGTTGFYRPLEALYASADGSVPSGPPEPPPSPLRPLAAPIVAARKASNLRRQALVRDALAAGDLEAMLPIVRTVVQRMGLAIDFDTPDGALLLHEALTAYSEVKDTAVLRDQGIAVPTPAAPVLPISTPSAAGTPKEALRLRDIKPDWLALKTRNTPAIKIMDRALALMADAKVDVPLAELDRQHGATLRAFIFATGVKGQSVKNLFVPLQSLLNTAVDAGKLKVNPWAGLRIDTSDSVQRQPWRSEDLKKLAEVNNTRDDCTRWLLPLALYTGCRAGEMAQAEISDIQEFDGIWCLEVHGRATEGHALRTVKTKAGERLIPIHQHLIDLGFLKYVESARTAGEGFVFPTFIGNGKRLPSDFASADFLKLREAAAVEIDERFTLHSIRHNVRSALAAAHVNDRIIDKLIGHESGTVQGRYTHATTATLQDAVSKLDWTNLGLR